MPTVQSLHVNGDRKAVDADGDRSLLSVLRDDLGLCGAKYGCGEGNCGACTVIVGGQRVRSCITRMSTVGTKPVRTIEGLATGDKLHPVQEAFLETCAMQCAYCTSGMIMSAVGLLEEKPHPSRDEIVKGMNGNVCRCGTYNRIVLAVEKAAGAMKGGAR
ncbi:MAG TPA: (2Fe-2S)-binding protein [Fimbriiglobus sp.]|jgi:aerobic-type carbon monoxide dehydrogenase small subunit (CoxS/CutS family)